MDDRFRLVYRGEILEGQHPAVVKQRIAQALNLDPEKADALFSGRTVVLKRDADAKTAARYQALFKKAGGRLRVLPVEALATGPDLGVQTNEQQPVSSSSNPIEAPNFEIAEPGALLREPTAPLMSKVREVSFDLAEVGADLSPERTTNEPISVAVTDFELAELGSNMGEIRQRVEPVIPDISHIKLVDA